MELTFVMILVGIIGLLLGMVVGLFVFGASEYDDMVSTEIKYLDNALEREKHNRRVAMRQAEYAFDQLLKVRSGQVAADEAVADTRDYKTVLDSV